MSRQLLKQIKVASPCHVSWAEMEGDAHKRFCKHCKHNVFNLSELTDAQAENLLREHAGGLCVRYYQRTDGTVITRNCPVGAAAIRRRLAIGLISTAALVVSAFGIMIRPPSARDAHATKGASSLSTGFGDSGPWRAFYDWLLNNPEPEPEPVVMGFVAAPTTPPLSSRSSSPPFGP